MSTWTPSIVPRDDQNVYLVLDDLGEHGRVWREADGETTDLETVITDLLDGQYSNPIRVIAFNTAEGCPATSRKKSPMNCDGGATCS